MGLRYVVITSVTRDDLPDGGASAFVDTVLAIRKKIPESKTEVLVPDFNGKEESLMAVISARPDVLNHNIEVPESLYPKIHRPLENYQQSLRVLERAKNIGAVTKSGMMIGLGETKAHILHTFSDLRRSGCDLLTIGQYLQPTKKNTPVNKYYSPLEFEQLKKIALDFGFKEVEAGPLVRSSYRAHKVYQAFQASRTH
jgi:lipoic acid synthetase